MKRPIIFSSILGALLLASCSNEIDVPDNPLALKNQVTFNSTIGERTSGTRASGTTWDSGDAIGVYALNEGQTLPGGIYDEKANIKHTTPGDGIFKPANTPIVFPDEGNLDFIAYYPYQETITDYKYSVDVSDQSKPAVIDLLYSDNAKGANKGEPNVSMTFKHKLSQLILNISQGDGITSLDGLTVKIENLKTNGSMNLADGSITLGSTVSVINPAVQTDEGKTMSAAILVPGQDLGDAKLTFTLDGRIYEWIPEAQALESGKKYTYPLQLSLTGLVTLQPGATIEDWEEGYTGTEDIILTPDENPEFIVDKPAVTLEGETLSTVVKLTAPADQDWTTSSNETWLSVTPTTGKGSGDITITAAGVNTTGADRSATVTITPTTKAAMEPVTISVTQKAEQTSTDPVIFYSETFTDATPEKAKFNSEGTSVSGFDFAEGKYTGTGADVRKTNAIGKHVWFPAYNEKYDPAYLNISNIPSGYTNIKLTYDIAANAADIPAKGLMIKCNDTEIAPSDVILGEQNKFSTITLDIPVDDVTEITFYTDETNEKGFRLDNIKLEGVKK